MSRFRPAVSPLEPRNLCSAQDPAQVLWLDPDLPVIPPVPVEASPPPLPPLSPIQQMIRDGEPFVLPDPGDDAFDRAMEETLRQFREDDGQ